MKNEPRYITFYRMMHNMEAMERVRYIEERGKLLATGECQIRWYDVNGLVWCVKSATQSDYTGLMDGDSYALPKYATPVTA